jgi:hypothetical protein
MLRTGFQLQAVLFLAAGLGCACSSVRVVNRTPDGGAIAIPNDSDQWPTYYRSQAERLMRQICPAGYVIDREEVVADEPARSAPQAANDTRDLDYSGGLERFSRYRQERLVITFHCAPPADEPPPVSAPVH